MSLKKGKIKQDVNNFLTKVKELACSKHVESELHINSKELEKFMSESSKLLVLYVLEIKLIVLIKYFLYVLINFSKLKKKLYTILLMYSKTKDVCQKSY